MEKLEIQPFKQDTSGRIQLPGSKSITNRALLFAALSKGKTRLEGILRSEDTDLMLECLRKLGVGIRLIPDDAVEVDGIAGQFPEKDVELYVGTAGTVARLLVGILGVQKEGRYRVDGSDVMRNRPMKGLTDLLCQLGCEIEFEGVDGALPFVLKPAGYQKLEVEVDASASSQVLSAALMAAPFADGSVTIRLKKEGIRKPYVIMTAQMMESFAVKGIEWNEAFTEFTVPNSRGYACESGCYKVESDASAASYFLALPFVIGGQMDVSRFDPNGLQGDVAFSEVLKQLGAKFERKGEGVVVKASEVPQYPQTFDFYPISDTFMTLASSFSAAAKTDSN